MSVIYSTLTESITKATFDSDNWNEDGSINWSFVDSDAYHECFKLYASVEGFYRDFNEIANVIIAEMREEAEAEAQFEIVNS
tara:strand:- start:619 stop:864 length:246 start_codon:yes stop_codon:yes gene_type:complete